MQIITITVRNRPCGKPAIPYYEPSTFTLRGAVLTTPEWIADDCIAFHDGTLMHIIPKRDVVSGIDLPTLPPPTSAPRVWQMRGSRGDLYTVTSRHDLWSCTCVGFSYRKDCRHIRECKSCGP